jgi:hypothetical protein
MPLANVEMSLKPMQITLARKDKAAGFLYLTQLMQDFPRHLGNHEAPTSLGSLC